MKISDLNIDDEVGLYHDGGSFIAHENNRKCVEGVVIGKAPGELLVGFLKKYEGTWAPSYHHQKEFERVYKQASKNIKNFPYMRIIYPYYDCVLINKKIFNKDLICNQCAAPAPHIDLVDYTCNFCDIMIDILSL